MSVAPDVFDGPEEPEHLRAIMAEAAAVDDAYGALAWRVLEPEKQTALAGDAVGFRAAAIEQAAELTRELTPEERAQLRLIEAIPELERTGARILSEIPAEPPSALLLGRLHAAAHTVLYGTGGSRKGTLAAWWIGGLVKDGHRVLIVDYEDHPDEWASRVRAMHGASVMDEVLHVAPAAVAWKGRRGALWRQADDLRALADAWGATYVVVDSIVVACGGEDPMDPGTPAKYAAGLQQLARPVLSLAHVTKDGGLAYPFGSVFWHNLARVTWSLETDGPRSVLTSRKANQHERAGRYLVDVTYRDNLPAEVWERPAALVLADRVAEVLTSEAAGLSVIEIVARLNEDLVDDETETKPDSVRKVLRRGLQATPRRFRVSGSESNPKWALG